ncbi:MAG: DUF4199 family protein [Opitutaceae bacterium]|nr:DUF4199 family protein [Opitutaceae bacterium]
MPWLRTGFVAGCLACAWYWLEYRLGFHTVHFEAGRYTRYAPLAILLLSLFAMFRRRWRRPGPAPALAEQLNAGVQASLVAGGITCCFLVIYSQQFNPGWIDPMLEWNVVRMRAAQVEEPAIRAWIVRWRQATSPAGLFTFLVAGSTLIGTLFSLALALLFRRGSR